MSPQELWSLLHQQGEKLRHEEALIPGHLNRVLQNCEDLGAGLAVLLSHELFIATSNFKEWWEVRIDISYQKLFRDLYRDKPELLQAATADLTAVMTRDPAAHSALAVFLFFKGFQALQAHRLAHTLWHQDRQMLALNLQARMARHYAVDIHPAARLGQGIMIDHAHGIVIGETAVVEDNVSMLHSVTLGGTGKTGGDRHPKIRQGVMIGAGAKILGNIEVGEGARIAAGSVVLHPVPPHVTVAGVPARVIGQNPDPTPYATMDQIV